MPMKEGSGDKPESISLVCLDADSIAYRASFATQDKPFSETMDSIDKLMEYCIQETVGFPDSDNFKGFLTGEGNFRYNLTDTYKNNRKKVEKPAHLPEAREYLEFKYDCEVSYGCEADDLIAMLITENNDPDTSVIISQDKDFKTINSWMFNYVKREWSFHDPIDALRNFYGQILTGDAADNIKGIYGIGPKKAEKALADLTTEEEMYSKVLSIYQDNSLTEDDMVLAGSLLWLWHKEGDTWVGLKN